MVNEQIEQNTLPFEEKLALNLVSDDSDNEGFQPISSCKKKKKQRNLSKQKVAKSSRQVKSQPCDGEITSEGETSTICSGWNLRKRPTNRSKYKK